MATYDPKSYWNMKARRSEGDAAVAACSFDPVVNRCIEGTQRLALQLVVQDLSKTCNLDVSRILDFGCGSGRWSEYLSDLGAGYFGTDISEEMISMCRNYHPTLTFETMNESQIPTESEQFDLAFSIAVLHHNRKPQKEVLLSEISRVLRPGGFLFLFEGVGLNPSEREFPHTVNEWIAMTKTHRFDCLGVRRFDYLPITNTVSRIADFVRVPFTTRWRFQSLDARFSPHLSRLFVRRNQGRAAILFQKHI